MKKYMTCFNEITEVEAEKETKLSVWITQENPFKTRTTVSRHAKMSSYECYFDTWDDAHKHLMDRAEAKLDTARARLQHAQGELGNIKGMKPVIEENGV